MLTFSLPETPTEDLGVLLNFKASFTRSDYRPSAISVGTVAIAVLIGIAAFLLLVNVMTAVSTTVANKSLI